MSFDDGGVISEHDLHCAVAGGAPKDVVFWGILAPQPWRVFPADLKREQWEQLRLCLQRWQRRSRARRQPGPRENSQRRRGGGMSE